MTSSNFIISKNEKPFKVKIIKQPIVTKMYKGRNGKIYKDTIYEFLGIKIMNPRIYYDTKNDEEFIIWYPKHEEILKILKATVNLRDGYTEEFFKEVIKVGLKYLISKDYSKEEIVSILREALKEIVKEERGEEDGRRENH